ncbi:MAG: prepilin-type N-terminal cleavage/methylation domain-containing protein [Lachnospiraceae bacterium]|nr:prepilin-type N-terminal cleavage/methylation domain-containing protein [Lachnospiraceae bacterium]
MRRIEKDNRGYSLVELIIVIAIIAAIGLVATLSAILIFNANGKTCANDIVGAISECKIMTMTKGQGSVQLLIYRDGANGNIYSELQIKDSTTGDWVTANGGPEKLGAKKCTVGTADGLNDLPESRDTAWRICFDRSTGAFKYAASAGDDENTTYGLGDIYVQGGNRRYHIKLEKLTGKQTIEKY